MMLVFSSSPPTHLDDHVPSELVLETCKCVPQRHVIERQGNDKRQTASPSINVIIMCWI